MPCHAHGYQIHLYSMTVASSSLSLSCHDNLSSILMSLVTSDILRFKKIRHFKKIFEIIHQNSQIFAGNPQVSTAADQPSEGADLAWKDSQIV